MARFHLHAFRAASRGSADHLARAADESAHQSAKARALIAEATDLPAARIEEDLQQGLWLDAREAETYGLVSRITMRGELGA
jgi:ATP-dependent protease ClpP protease subunit